MLPEIKIGIRSFNVQNVSIIGINWKKLITNLREQKDLTLNQIASFSGVSHTKLMKASANQAFRFSDCEKIALLDLHQEHCEKLHNISILED